MNIRYEFELELGEEQGQEPTGTFPAWMHNIVNGLDTKFCPECGDSIITINNKDWCENLPCEWHS